MAFRKTLAHRLYHITRISSPAVNYTPLQAILPSNPATTTFRRDFFNASDSCEKGFFRRFLQKREIFQSTTSADVSTGLIGDNLMKRLKDMSRDRIRLDGLYPPLETKSDPPEEISVQEAKKILRVSQLETLKSTLREIPRSQISYTEFHRICSRDSSPDNGLRLAKMLDDSGCVIVLGNVVFLHPEQEKNVTKAIQGVIPLSIPEPNDPRRQELEKMEKEKTEIDRQAELRVRRELWAGLGFLVVQTLGCLRLTFWELSWDVMEPICFYLTSIYFMAGYSFFLRTSKEPSFEGFFENRFCAKQKRVMKEKKFDVERFNELRRACYPFSSEQPLSVVPSFDSLDHRTLVDSDRH